jgi:hypothetical protein
MEYGCDVFVRLKEVKGGLPMKKIDNATLQRAYAGK